MQMDLTIDDADTLKDKRRVIKSLKDRISHGRNVSVAEVGGLDVYRSCVLAVVMVGNEAGYVEGALRKIVDFVKATPSVGLEEFQIDLL